MFKVYFFFLIGIIFPLFIVSQIVDTCLRNNQNCIFFTYDDFKQCSPSLKIFNSDNESIHYYFPYGLSNIKIIKNDTIVPLPLQKFFVKKKNGKLIFKFKHGTIYGYCKNGQFYRYYSEPKNWKIYDGYYKLEEKGAIIIYSMYISNGGKTGSSLYYFYSLGLDSQIKKLKLKNIEADFRSNSILLEKIKSNKTLMKNLWAKDSTGKFIINNVISFQTHGYR